MFKYFRATTSAPVDPTDAAHRQVELVAISRLKRGSSNMRPAPDFNYFALRSLMITIEAVGLLQPIVVRRAAAGDLFVEAGQRRLVAAKLLGWTKIPAVVVDDASADMAFHVENEQRRRLHCVVRAWATAKLFAEKGLTQEELAELLGVSRTEIADDLAIAQLPRWISDEALALGDKIARAQLVEVASCEDEERRREIWVAAKSGMTRDALRAAKSQRPPRCARRSLRASVGGIATITARVRRLRGAINAAEHAALIAELKAATAQLSSCIAQLEEDPPRPAGRSARWRLVRVALLHKSIGRTTAPLHR